MAMAMAYCSCSQYERSVELLRGLGEEQKLAATLTRCGCIRKSTYATARNSWQESIAIFERTGNRAGLANALNNIGLCMQRAGDFADALACFERAVAIQEVIGDRAELVVMLGNQAYELLRSWQALRSDGAIGLKARPPAGAW